MIAGEGSLSKFDNVVTKPESKLEQKHSATILYYLNGVSTGATAPGSPARIFPLNAAGTAPCRIQECLPAPRRTAAAPATVWCSRVVSEPSLPRSGWYSQK